MYTTLTDSTDEEVASYVMRQLGQRRARIFSEQYSYGADTVRDGVSFSKQEEDQYLVNYSDIQSLPDLTCYVTLPGQYPVVRMNMVYEKMDFIAAEFLPRELNDSLDQAIEEEITRRELDSESVDRLLGTPDDTSQAASSTVPEKTVPAPATAASPVSPVVSAVAPAVIASVAEEDKGGRVKEMEGLVVDTGTGEVMEVREGQDDYEAYQQEAMQAMREEEKNILVHRGHDEPDDGSEPGDDW
ncbi:hypothetical protein CYD30_26370 [Kosakonia cowanii]|nr:hypothetical protein CYD30_26370 [Kosakonia cowanii]